MAAIHGAQQGARVCCIEMNDLGGTCLHKGCIPTKYLLAAADKLTKARDMEQFGLTVHGTLLWKKVLEGKDKVVSIQSRGIDALFRSWNITFLKGRASFLTPTALRVHNERERSRDITAQKVIVAAGSSPSSIPGIEWDGQSIVNSDHILDLQTIPESVLIIGAGAIGCEFACLFSTLGTKVTLVEMMSRPLPLEDEEISDIFSRELKKRHIVLRMETRVSSLAKKNGTITARFEEGESVVVERVLVATGRKKNTDGLGLENIGITDLRTNEKMETGIKGIYAVGDVVGKKMLAHVASREGIVAIDNALGKPACMDYRVIPSTTFSTPEVASVGMTESQARNEHGDIAVGRFPFRVLGKAHVLGEIAGMIKVVTQGKHREIIGAHIIGPHATELIHELCLAMAVRARAQDLSEIIHAHPTLGEAVSEAMSAVSGHAIHLPREPLRKT